MMKTLLPRAYLISDRKLFSTQEAFLKQVEALLAAGVRMLQVREKDLASNELYELSLKLRKLTHNYGCLLLINDRLDIALACQADGVHLGTMSMPTQMARQLLGQDKIIGVSTHHQSEIAEAARTGANFVTFGPVYYTESKAKYGAPVGIHALRQACANPPIPIYALGGIKAEHVKDLQATGIYGVAAISSLLKAQHPEETIKVIAFNQ